MNCNEMWNYQPEAGSNSQRLVEMKVRAQLSDADFRAVQTALGRLNANMHVQRGQQQNIYIITLTFSSADSYSREILQAFRARDSQAKRT